MRNAKLFQNLTALRPFGTTDRIVKQDAKVFSTVQLIGGLAAFLGIVLLYLFSPAEHSFYPRCLFHSWTGLSCPGCGSLRALHELLNGNLKTAFSLNPLLIAYLPIVGIFFVSSRLHVNKMCIWIVAIVVVVFAVARNWTVVFN